MQRRVLVVDDDRLLPPYYERFLSNAGFTVNFEASFSSARLRAEPARFAAEPIDVVVLDLELSDGPGDPLAATFKALEPTPGVLVVSGLLTASRVAALLPHVDAVLPKPFDAGALVASVNFLLSRRPDSVVSRFSATHRLSDRETAVLEHAMQALNNKQIASALGCEQATIATYWNRIFRKTDRHSQRDVLGKLLETALRESRKSSLRG